MIETEFGKLVEKLIYFSEQKHYSLAKELGYDVSYISKWISGKTLPSSKNISLICTKIADFTINNCNDESINKMVDYFKINIQNNNEDKGQELKVYIEEKLYELYIKSNNQEKANNSESNEANSTTYVNPILKKKSLDEYITTVTKNKEKVDIILLADLFSLNEEDKIDIARIRKGVSRQNDMSNVNIRFLISFDQNIDNIIFNVILFINMIRNYSDIKFDLYSCKHSSFSLVLAVKDVCFHNAMYTETQKCLFTNTSKDKKVIKDIYDTLEQMIDTRSRLTFDSKTPKEMILQRNYMQYIIGYELKWLIGNINEMFMPSDLFLEIGQEVFGDSKEILEELKKIDAILQNATYNSDLKVLIYNSVIRDYISTGKINFFNVPINLTLEQRQRHIEHMNKLFKNNENIDIRIIEGNLIEEFKHNENPSLYISKNLSFLTIQCNENVESNKYLISKDQRLEDIFKIFFDEIWHKENKKINKDKQEITNRISELITYAKILNER